MKQSSIPPTMDEIVDFLEQSNFIEGEMTGLDEAVKAWQYIVKKPRLNVGRILHVHEILMKNKPIPRELKGAWRKPMVDKDGRQLTGNVSVGGKNKPNWYAVSNLMADYIQAMNNSIDSKLIETDEHARGTAIAMHINFEDIHPFIDGNGRVGRILMNWHLNRLKQPLLIIYEEDRQEYYQWFRS